VGVPWGGTGTLDGILGGIVGGVNVIGQNVLAIPNLIVQAFTSVFQSLFGFFELAISAVIAVPLGIRDHFREWMETIIGLLGGINIGVGSVSTPIVSAVAGVATAVEGIRDWFVVDTAVISAAVAVQAPPVLPVPFAPILGTIDFMQDTIDGLDPQLMNIEYPKFTIKVHWRLRDLISDNISKGYNTMSKSLSKKSLIEYHDDGMYLVVIDFDEYRDQFAFIRLFLKCSLYIGLFWYLLRMFEHSFSIT
jgi:hypothetical protein